MPQELLTVGKKFKDKREEMNLSLKEIENATSIRVTHLEAIEEGRTEKMLAPVYVLGFVRQYATFLGLDGDKIIEENPEAFKMETKAQEFSYGIGTLETRGTPKGSSKLMPNLMWTVLGIGALTLAWYLAKSLGVI